MPIAKRWSDFSKIRAAIEDENFGAYELADSGGNVIYIGQGKVQSRLLSHFVDGGDPIPGASLYRVDYTGSARRAEQRERALLRTYERRHGRLPRFNQRDEDPFG